MMVFNAPGGNAPVESEDCLYLNVFAPNTPPPAGGRPVMFWIYGGGLQFGSAMQHGYDGSAFAAYQDVVVVTPNYRTNGKPTLNKYCTEFLSLTTAAWCLNSFRLLKLTRHPTGIPKCWFPGPALRSKMGPGQYCPVRRGPTEGHHFWRVGRRFVRGQSYHDYAE